MMYSNCFSIGFILLQTLTIINNADIEFLPSDYPDYETVGFGTRDRDAVLRSTNSQQKEIKGLKQKLSHLEATISSQDNALSAINRKLDALQKASERPAKDMSDVCEADGSSPIKRAFTVSGFTKNLAKGKSATQCGNYRHVSGTSYDWWSEASSAVDGNIYGYHGYGTCAYTTCCSGSCYYPWWAVDLGCEQTVRHVIIHGAVDGLTSTHSAHLQVGLTNDNPNVVTPRPSGGYPICGTYTEPDYRNRKTINCLSSLPPGRFLIVQKTVRDHELILCEVEVY